MAEENDSIVEISNHKEEYCKRDRQYISLWKDLGGQNLCFYPGGQLHPIQFLKKLTHLLNEAAVPNRERVGLAVNCLNSSAGEWGAYKEQSFKNFENVADAFKSRYWGVDQERELFWEIKYANTSRVIELTIF